MPTANLEEGVRVDSGVVSGNDISSFYDPMISKLIVHAESRPAALRKLERALRGYQVAGLSNNIDFLIKIVQVSLNFRGVKEAITFILVVSCLM
tara:strand:- start:25 stop:306 length:282 start_codon:yes stop_codon:yes gene_type:complete